MKSKLSPRNVQRRREGTVRAKVGSLKYAAMKIGCTLPTLYDLIQGEKLRSYHISSVPGTKAIARSPDDAAVQAKSASPGSETE